MLGKADPRTLAGSGTIDPRIARQLRGYHNQDPPPSRLKPIPLPILHGAYDIATAAGDAESLAAADMMWLAFFFLLRPGEYTDTTKCSHPFRIQDVGLWINNTPIQYVTASIDDLSAITFVSLTFVTQKNGNKGEVVGHGRSGHPSACPVRAIIRRLLHLRAHGANDATPLCHFKVAPTTAFIPLAASTITHLLRHACLACGESLGFRSSDIAAKSLRASGAMALLNENVDPHKIQLIGRWKSDAMIRYLHIQAHSVMSGFATLMLQGGNYALIPTDPDAALPTCN